MPGWETIVATSDIRQSGEEGLIRNAILIAGPTASGKSALALELARRLGGRIVNTDSMQAYSVLRVITARPADEELATAPHFLYGHVHPGTAYSTGAWLRDVRALAETGELAGGPSIFVGGTGLYFRALALGISEMPDIPPSIRARWRHELAEKGSTALHRILLREDPEAAMLLRPADGHRIVRALEVLQASGQSILRWRTQGGKPLIEGESARFLVVEPDRAGLIARIEARFDRMVGDGAIGEVERLMELRLDPGLPAMKAIGVPEIQAALSGRLTIAEAISRAKIATRQYAKRQATCFRHQLGSEWQRIGSAEDAGKLCPGAAD